LLPLRILVRERRQVTKRKRQEYRPLFKLRPVSSLPSGRAPALIFAGVSRRLREHSFFGSPREAESGRLPSAPSWPFDQRQINLPSFRFSVKKMLQKILAKNASPDNAGSRRRALRRRVDRVAGGVGEVVGV
jgi:hypothetical protein